MRFLGFIVKVDASLATAFLLVSVVAVSEHAAAKDVTAQCEPRILRAPTRFPEKAQNHGAGGAVQVRVLLDSERVLESALARSSGYVLLDSAAVESVRQDWGFDVSHCDASTLPLSIVVTVRYTPVPKYISFSNERRFSVHAISASNERCTITPTNRKEQLISCVR